MHLGIKILFVSFQLLCIITNQWILTNHIKEYDSFVSFHGMKGILTIKEITTYEKRNRNFLSISVRMHTENVIRIPDWKPRLYLQFCH